MATKNNPGKFDCYANADPDEPMFVLLGRDPDAAVLVREWADRRQARGENRDKVAEARACADAMDAWRTRSVIQQPCEAKATVMRGKVARRLRCSLKAGHASVHYDCRAAVFFVEGGKQQYIVNRANVERWRKSVEQVVLSIKRAAFLPPFSVSSFGLPRDWAVMDNAGRIVKRKLSRNLADGVAESLNNAKP